MCDVDLIVLVGEVAYGLIGVRQYPVKHLVVACEPVLVRVRGRPQIDLDKAVPGGIRQGIVIRFLFLDAIELGCDICGKLIVRVTLHLGDARGTRFRVREVVIPLVQEPRTLSVNGHFYRLSSHLDFSFSDSAHACISRRKRRLAAVRLAALAASTGVEGESPSVG